MPRDERGDVERADRLDRFWDEVLLGSPDPIPTTGPDPASAEVVRRLNTLTGDPASEEAREHVWQRLLDHDPALARQVERKPLGGTGQSLTTPNGRAPTAASRPSPTRLTRARRFWPLLEFAAAAALILGLLGLLGSYLAEPQVLPRIAALWRDPVAPAVPMARGGPARTGEMPGPAPEGEPDERWRVPPPPSVAARAADSTHPRCSPTVWSTSVTPMVASSPQTQRAAPSGGNSKLGERSQGRRQWSTGRSSSAAMTVTSTPSRLRRRRALEDLDRCRWGRSRRG
ncbi:MAG: hypothetical protein M3R02_28900 [Chloroflexota bacterium]|nr:hypothetical protein [Chloroflexota bacterium]